MPKKLNMDNPLFQETKPVKMGRPRKQELIRDNSVQEGLTADYTRATFILKVDTLNDLKDYAYTERLTIKDAVDNIISEYMTDYKKNHTLLSHKGDE